MDIQIPGLREGGLVPDSAESTAALLLLPQMQITAGPRAHQMEKAWGTSKGITGVQ